MREFIVKINGSFIMKNGLKTSEYPDACPCASMKEARALAEKAKRIAASKNAEIYEFYGLAHETRIQF